MEGLIVILHYIASKYHTKPYRMQFATYALFELPTHAFHQIFVLYKIHRSEEYQFLATILLHVHQQSFVVFLSALFQKYDSSFRGKIQPLALVIGQLLQSLNRLYKMKLPKSPSSPLFLKDLDLLLLYSEPSRLQVCSLRGLYQLYQPNYLVLNKHLQL